jgi:hypothetical protein
VSVNLNRQAIKASPGFDSTAELNHRHEMELHQHYQRSGYWEKEPTREMAKNHDKLKE